MSTDETTLAPFYHGWEGYQQLLTEAIAPLLPEHLALRAAPSLRPVGSLATHIIGARARWFLRVLGEEQPALEPLVSWDRDDAPQRSAAELAEGLAASWRMIQACLDRWTPAMLADAIQTRWGATLTRQWILWHVLEHDLHHGGELFLTLGIHGQPTPEL